MESAKGSAEDIQLIHLELLGKPLEFVRADHSRRRALCRMIEEHSREQCFAREIREALSGLVGDGTPVPERPDLQDKMPQNASRERRHLDLGNSIVIPIARARPFERDLGELSGRAAARRGVRPADRGGP